MQGPGRSGRGPTGFGSQMPGHFAGAPVTKWLLISNIAIFFLQVLMTKAGQPLYKQELFEFSIQKGIYDGQIWRLLTFQFMHGDLGHLFGNCFALFIFGPHVERWMTNRAFGFYYFFCGLAGVILYIILFSIPGVFDHNDPSRGMVGASAGIFGILAAFYFIAPNVKILLFFIIPMPMKYFAVGYFLYEVLIVVTKANNAGGSAAHLGGALFGLAVLKWPPLHNQLVKISQIGTGRKSRNPKVRDAKIIKKAPESPIEITKEVDRILDKISEEGIQSLTPKEKEILNKARRK